MREVRGAVKKGDACLVLSFAKGPLDLTEAMLEHYGVSPIRFDGDIKADARTAALKSFQNGGADVLLATVAWGVDNTLSRGLAERDPSQVVMAKALLGAAATACLAIAWGEPLPSLKAALGLFAVGATGYGLSLRFYLLAQRAFGAARTGSVFAFAPFIGAAVAFGFGERSAGWLMLLGGLLMLAGVLLHLAESHGHEHTHEPMEHEHAHRHDDGHHSHVHDVMPTGSHSHVHFHEPVTHAHPHAPDVHHQHRH